MKSKFSECPDFSCSRSDGTLGPVTSSFSAASESLRANSQSSAVVRLGLLHVRATSHFGTNTQSVMLSPRFTPDSVLYAQSFMYASFYTSVRILYQLCSPGFIVTRRATRGRNRSNSISRVSERTTSSFVVPAAQNYGTRMANNYRPHFCGTNIKQFTTSES